MKTATLEEWARLTGTYMHSPIPVYAKNETGGEYKVASVYGRNQEEKERNARLCSLAPDLLRALTRLAYDVGNSRNAMVIEKIRAETLPEALAVLAKAESS